MSLPWKAAAHELRRRARRLVSLRRADRLVVDVLTRDRASLEDELRQARAALGLAHAELDRLRERCANLAGIARAG